MPGQPSSLRATEVTETSVFLQWSRPQAAGENIVSYELYWNDTFAKVFITVNIKVLYFMIKKKKKINKQKIKISICYLINVCLLQFQEKQHHRRIPFSESYRLTNLYPNTLYYIWLAARSTRGEGATTSALAVRTKQYGEWAICLACMCIGRRPTGC